MSASRFSMPGRNARPAAVRWWARGGAVGLLSFRALVEDSHRVACRFTRADPPLRLCWEGDDGSSGSLALESRGKTTWADYHAVYVPKAAADKVAAGLIGAFARGKAQRETDNDAASELGRLAGRVRRRADGKPVDGRVPRFMLDLCDHGAGTRCRIRHPLPGQGHALPQCLPEPWQLFAVE